MAADDVDKGGFARPVGPNHAQGLAGHRVALHLPQSTLASNVRFMFQKVHRYQKLRQPNTMEQQFLKAATTLIPQSLLQNSEPLKPE